MTFIDYVTSKHYNVLHDDVFITCVYAYNERRVRLIVPTKAQIKLQKDAHDTDSTHFNEVRYNQLIAKQPPVTLPLVQSLFRFARYDEKGNIIPYKSWVSLSTTPLEQTHQFIENEAIQVFTSFDDACNYFTYAIEREIKRINTIDPTGYGKTILETALKNFIQKQKPIQS